MYQELRGDLFRARVQVIVNPVNCRGVMGAGLALDFARRFPMMVERYRKICLAKELRPGVPYLEKQTTPWILHFPTKDHWIESSRVRTIEQGLKVFCRMYEAWGISSIAFPKLGCGLGKLSWEQEVKPLYHTYLVNLPIEVQVYM